MHAADVVLGDLSLAEVRSASAVLPTAWVAELDEDFVDEHAEAIDAFFRRVIPQLPPAEAFEMAAQCQRHYVLGLAHLDALHTAADLLIGSIRRLLDHMASVLDDTEPLACGPDAGVSQSTYERLRAAAATLRSIDLQIEPPAPVEL